MFRLDGNPWRCWERTTLAGVLNGPEDLLVRVALQDRKSRYYQTEFRWPALSRLGPNDYRGQYAQVTLRFGSAEWSFEVANDGEQTILLIRPIDPNAAEGVQIRLETLFLRPNGGEIVAREEEVVARRQGRGWRTWSPSPTSHRDGATLTAPLRRHYVAVIEPAPDLGRRLESRTEGERVSAGPDAPPTAQEKHYVAKVNAARAAYLGRFKHVPKELWWMYAAIPYGIGWNMIWAADRGEPLEVCSRDWCVHGNYGEWVLFNWDTWLIAAAAADYDTELAHQIVRPQMAVQTPEGLVPGIASPLGYTADRGMPPDASYGLWKAYQRSNDRSFVEEYFDGLARYNAWWQRNRDGNNDGLLEWGSNPADPPHPQWQAHTYWASRYETGMDNHPMWDDTTYNPLTCTQEQTDIGLSALHAWDAAVLARMADLLSRKKEAQRYRDRAGKLAQLIDKNLWNDDVGLWLSRGWDGEWCHRAASTCFYPIYLTEVASGHVDRAVREHLENPGRFGGKYGLPVSPKDDPAYPEQYYVRGRIWPAQTLLVHWALREAGQEEAAANLARRCIETMREEWLDAGHLHETYNADTASGDDTAESDPLYSFGIMLPQVAWNHLRDWKLDGTEVTADLNVFKDHLDTDGRLRARVEPVEKLESLVD